jgi:hypothetical protein
MRRIPLLALASLAWLGGCDSNAVGVRDEPEVARYEPIQVRYQVDAYRDRVWRLNREGVVVHDPRQAEKIALPLPGWVAADAPHACLPDLALGPRGEAIVTSNVLATLWRIDPETLAVTVHPLALDADDDKDIGFSALVYSSQHDAYFGVSATHRSLWKIDAALTRADKIAVSERFAREACELGVGARVVSPYAGRMGGRWLRTPG